MANPDTNGWVDYSLWAQEILKTKKGVGMVPPFYAETASMRGDKSWPMWIVRNKTCNSLGGVLPREIAEKLADAMNEAANHG